MVEGMMSPEGLRARRLLAEANALVAEALLEAPDGEDVVVRRDDDDDDDDAEDENDDGDGDGKPSASAASSSSERNNVRVLVPAGERVGYARSHYESARRSLDEALIAMARMKAARIHLGDEKEDVGYLVMMLVGVGNDLEEAEREEGWRKEEGR